VPLGLVWLDVMLLLILDRGAQLKGKGKQVLRMRGLSHLRGSRSTLMLKSSSQGLHCRNQVCRQALRRPCLRHHRLRGKVKALRVTLGIGSNMGSYISGCRRRHFA
jgi:hypothetical protein